MNSIGYTTVTWIGRGALILVGLMLVSGFTVGNPLGAILFVALVCVPVAGICAAVRARMLERRLAVALMRDGSDTTQQTHALPWKR